MRRRWSIRLVVLAVTVLSVSAWGAGTSVPAPETGTASHIDLATLMPPDTIAYAESGSLGRQIGTALEMLEGTPLEGLGTGMANAPSTGGPGGPQALAAVMNPAMVAEARKLRGWAVGFQGLDMAGPEPRVVSVLDLGEGNGLRPMLTMGIMMAGVPAGRIEGMDVVRVNAPPGGGIAYDDRIVIYGRPYEQMEWCVRQYTSGCAGESLLTANESFARFPAEPRSGCALAAWVDMVQVLPSLQGLGGPEAEQGMREFATAVAMAGVEDATLRVVLDPANPILEANVGLGAWRPAAADQMVRTGPLGTGILNCVPPETIALIAGGMSRKQRDDLAMQLHVGHDANPVDGVERVALFMVPPDPEAAMLSGVPVAVAEGLGMAATLGEGSSAEEAIERLRTCVETLCLQTGLLVQSVDAGDGMVEFSLPPGSPVPALYMAPGEGYIVASLNPDLVRSSLSCASSGRSALTGGPLHEQLAGLDPAVSAVALGRVAELVGAISAARNAADPMDEELAGLLADLTEVLRETNVQLTASEHPHSFTVRAGAHDLPALRDALPVLTALRQYRPFVPPFEPVAVSRSATGIRVDGEVDDWAGAKALPWTQGWEGIGQARLAWRDDGLYGLVTSMDDDVQGNDAQPWTDDGLQVFIETDNARRRGFSDQSRGILLWPTGPAGPDGANIQTEDHGGETSQGIGTDFVSGIQCAWDFTDSGYAMEFYIPASALGAGQLKAGSEIGLCLFLRDGSVTPAASFCALEGADTWQHPDMWGAIRLAAN